MVRGVSATGIKSVTINEPYFQGHFPRWPVMPGVLIVEAMAQTAAVLVVDAIGDEARGKLVYFTSIDDARFRRPVAPGSTLHVHVERKASRGTGVEIPRPRDGRRQVDGGSDLWGDDHGQHHQHRCLTFIPLPSSNPAPSLPRR